MDLSKHAEHHGTLTGTRGEAISLDNQGNKINSFDHNRVDERGVVFEDNYNDKMNELERSCR